MIETIQFKLNGKMVRVRTDSERVLLWVLRTDLGITGPKYGCGEGHCGACTVLVKDEATLSCQITLKEVEGSDVITIEGLSKGDKLHPVQEAFIQHDALQCGFCTPGMILNAYSLLKENPNLTREDIVDGMEGNLCRCGAHVRIIQAIESAAAKMNGGM
ncbi:MAG: (2Fe-2S)-binding protein [Deltaproteobacteria bacterium]|nr:(2Fe-2S)-binding protein [Deltaproteobacteria bacterium]